MSLRLFHITEFAESRLLSPASQRDASHPFVLVLLFSLWLASICNLALWQALSRLPDLGTGAVWRIGIGLALMMACAFIMLLSLLTWRWTLKLSLTLLLLLAAFNAHFMLTQGTFINADLIRRILHNPAVQLRALLSWQFFMIVLLLAVVPIILLWRMPVRRTLVRRSLMQNLALFATAGMALGGLWLLNHQTVSTLVHSQPQLRQLFNPFNMFQSLVHKLVPALQSWL
jgi:lipid A ethanolaminephosphotransferase